MYSDTIRERARVLRSQGMSAMQVSKELGVSKGTIERWRSLERPRYMTNSSYPVSVIQEALQLAYGPDAIGLLRTSERLGISKGTIAGWKWRYPPESAMMEKPNPSDARIALSDTSSMSEEEKDRRIHELELRTAVLEEELRILKADGASEMGSQERARIVDALSDRFRKSELFEAVGITSATYYYQVSIRTRPDKYAQVRAEIAEVFKASNGCYGYRRLHAVLASGGRRISEKVIARLMREEGLVATCAPRRTAWSSYDGERSQAPPNHMARDFHADAPGLRWVTDITEMKAADGKVYLSPVIDCYDGMVVAFEMGRNPTAALANSMLRKALATLPQGALPPMVHSDRGGHYRWPGWLEICESARVLRSMSKKGCSPDNAACEGFFGTFKSEAYYPLGWKRLTVEGLIAATERYIEWYNVGRIKSTLGWMSPVEYRKAQGVSPEPVS